MKKPQDVIKDLLSAGFDFRPTKHKNNAVEILYDDRWWRLYVREERMLIMAIVRTDLRDIGYSEVDLRMVRDTITAYAHGYLDL